MLPDALHHALAAGDMELVARMVSANVLVLVEDAELAPILLRMDAAPERTARILCPGWGWHMPGRWLIPARWSGRARP